MKYNRVIDSEFFYGATPEILLRAAQLRKNMTKAEQALWSELRSKKTGFTFRRQHPVNLFIADFYCHKAKLAVEVDGSIHDIEDIRARDSGREDEFAKYGILTIRFTNEEIFSDVIGVIKRIRDVCNRRASQD